MGRIPRAGIQELRIDRVGEVELGLCAKPRTQIPLAIAGPDHERLAEVVKPRPCRRLGDPDVVGQGREVQRRAETQAQTPEEIGALRTRPVRAPERVTMDHVEQAGTQPPTALHAPRRSWPPPPETRRRAGRCPMSAPAYPAMAPALGRRRGDGRPPASATVKGPPPAGGASGATTATNERKPMGNNTRSGATAAPRRPASAFVAAVRSAAEGTGEHHGVGPKAGIVVPQPLDPLRPAVGDARDLVEEPEATAIVQHQRVGGVHQQRQVPAPQPIDRHVRDTPRRHPAGDQIPDGLLDGDRFAHPPRAAEQVQASRRQIVEDRRPVVVGRLGRCTQVRVHHGSTD